MPFQRVPDFGELLAPILCVGYALHSRHAARVAPIGRGAGALLPVLVRTGKAAGGVAPYPALIESVDDAIVQPRAQTETIGVWFASILVLTLSAGRGLVPALALIGLAGPLVGRLRAPTACALFLAFPPELHIH